MSGFVSAARGFPFRVAYPWALIERNSGHQIAYLTECKVSSDGRMAYKGHIWSMTDGSYSKTARPISTDRIRRTWRNPPSDDAIRVAKRAANKKLRAEERAKGFGRALRRTAA